MLVSSLLFALRQQRDTSETEARVREHFESLLQDPGLLELPLAVLLRVVRCDVSDTENLFRFLKKCLDRFGPPASVLLKDFDIRRLSLEDLSILESNDRFNWAFAGESRNHVICEVVSRCLKLEQQVRRLIEENDALRSNSRMLQEQLVQSTAKFESAIAEERKRICDENELRFSEAMEKLTGEIRTLVAGGLSEHARLIGEQQSEIRNLENARDELQRKIDKVQCLALPLGGIIADLTRKCGGNVHEGKVVNVTAGNECSSSAKCAVDLADKSDSNFGSKNGSLDQQWLCYDFRDKLVRPTHYTIRSRYSSGGPCECSISPPAHPKSWVVEGSMDGSSWTELDRREKNDELNGWALTRSFSMTQTSLVRMIRLRLTEPSHGGRNQLALSAFEVFGYISW